jgi:hypothetical protein
MSAADTHAVEQLLVAHDHRQEFGKKIRLVQLDKEPITLPGFPPFLLKNG